MPLPLLAGPIRPRKWFLIHYGPKEAMCYVLGRGKLLNNWVLDVRVSSYSAISESSHRATCQCVDSIVNWSAAFPLSCLNSSTPLLAHAVSFRQVAMGAGRLYASSFTLWRSRKRGTVRSHVDLIASSHSGCGASLYASSCLILLIIVFISVEDLHAVSSTALRTGNSWFYCWAREVTFTNNQKKTSTNTFATLLNCSNRFWGKKVTTMYFEVIIWFVAYIGSGLVLPRALW